MADMAINGTRYAKGKLSISRRADITQNPVQIYVSGVLSVHRYFEEISEIETMRYKLTGVRIVQEDFGSDDHQIVYTFIADNLEVKGIDLNNESLFNMKQVEDIEELLYPGKDINDKKDGEKDDRKENK